MSPKRKADAVGPRKGSERAISAPAPDSGSTKAHLDKAIREREELRYVLKLYVTGLTRASGQAIERVRAVCEEHLHGRYELEVIDIYQRPALAKGEQIVATPTLIKVLPSPLRRYIGNLANVEKILFGLDLREKR
jgi:circadian clock protein KaiB